MVKSGESMKGYKYPSFKTPKIGGMGGKMPKLGGVAKFKFKKKAKKHKNWIANAIKKPGALHAELGVKKGEKIPASKLAKAAKKGGKEGKRARLAETLKSFHAKKHMKKMKKHEKKEGKHKKHKKMEAPGFPYYQGGIKNKKHKLMCKKEHTHHKMCK